MLHIFFHRVVVMMTRGHVVVHFAFLHAFLHIFRACDRWHRELPKLLSRKRSSS